MRITYLTHFPGRGGSTSLLQQVMQNLEAFGHQSSVVVGADCAKPQLKKYSVFKPSVSGDWRQRLKEYRSLVESTQPDLVYAISGMEENDLLRFLRLPRVRHISTVEQHEFLDSPYYISQHARYWEGCSVNTPDVFDFLKTYGPFDFTELEAPYEIDAAFQNASPKPRLRDTALEVCLMTRLERFQKRMHWLPEIVSGCKRAGLSLRWHIYGEGPAEKIVRAGLARFGCADLVTFHGWVSGPDMAKQAVSHDLFFSCSRFEGLPISMVEAMFCGLACAVPDLPGGIRYIIAKGGCYPFRAESPSACVQALMHIAEDKSKVEEKGKEARKVAQEFFGKQVIAEKYARLEKGIRKLSFNGKVENIERARKIYKVKPLTYLKRRILGISRDM